MSSRAAARPSSATRTTAPRWTGSVPGAPEGALDDISATPRPHPGSRSARATPGGTSLVGLTTCAALPAPARALPPETRPTPLLGAVLRFAFPHDEGSCVAPIELRPAISPLLPTAKCQSAPCDRLPQDSRPTGDPHLLVGTHGAGPAQLDHHHGRAQLVQPAHPAADARAAHRRTGAVRAGSWRAAARFAVGTRLTAASSRARTS